jgi:hypothetical protein
MQKCLGSDAKAKEIFEADMACGLKCGSDDACQGKCSEQTDTSCQSAQDSCQKMDQCSGQCMPKAEQATDPSTGQ